MRRWRSDANLNIPLHCLVLDGVYRRTEGEPVFQQARAPTRDELQGPAHKPAEHAAEHAHTWARMGWARLLKRVFEIDLEHGPQCGGEFRIIAAIEAPVVMVRILTHLGLPARALPRSPARPLSLFQAA